MPRKRSKHNKPAAAFANGLLEAVATASGAGWFSDNQQRRLRTIIREEFGDLMDVGLLYDNVQLDQFEHSSELTHFPDGNRPNHDPDSAESSIETGDTVNYEELVDAPDDSAIEVEEVTISPPICECSSQVIHPNCRVISVE